MSPLTLLWASVVAFVAGFWLGGIALIWLMDYRTARHASRGSNAGTNRATRDTALRVAHQNRAEPWGER